MTEANGLQSTLDSARLLVMCGSGGVGKTTTAAALAVTAALRGRRVLVLTIDPAQRLLQALGLHGSALPPNVPHEVLPRLAATLDPARAGQDGVGALHAMMLDAEAGAVAMVERLLPEASQRQQVLNNRVYRAFLPTLQASPDYIALELIATLFAQGRFDLIVLDTPPMHNVLDFLNAGSTLSAFINDKVLKWFARVPAPGQKSRLSLISTGTSMAMSILGRLFGGDALPDIAAFFASFQDVLPRLKQRTQETDALLRSPQTRFVVVTAPGETALREARHLHGELHAHGITVAGFVVNRVIQLPARLGHEIGVGESALADRLASLGLEPERARALGAALQVTATRLQHLAHADEAQVAALEALAGGRAFCTVASQREHEIHTLAELAHLGAHLLDGVRARVVS